MSTVKASIAGVAFTFEREAYTIMHNYISHIESAYLGTADGAEIVADIEARIAELLLSEKDDKAIGVELSQRIVDQIGYTDDLNTPTEAARTLPRRLYRNPDGAVLGGVCSGLATYFNIDRVWIRIILVLSFFASPLFGGFFGALVLAYFIMWIVVPMARTPRQKFEMHGTPITAERIEQQFRAEATATAQNLRSQQSASAWANFVYILGRIAVVCLKIVGGIIAFSLMAALAGVIVGLVMVASGTEITPDVTMDVVSWRAFVIMLLVAVIVPLAIIVYSILAGLFKKRVSRPMVITVMSIWVLLVVFLSVIGSINYDSLHNGVKELDKNDIIRHEQYDENLFDGALPNDTIPINETDNTTNKTL